MTIRTSARTRGYRGLSRPLHYLVAMLLLAPLTAVGVVAAAGPASAAGVVSTINPDNGFPYWYEDAAGTRIDGCLDPTNPNCVLPAVPGVFDPAQPIVFPTNFPPEVFYNLADASIATPGCAGTAPGVAKLRLAVEAAFLGGTPSPTDRMTFGRVRVHVSSGLCPLTTYQFVHPFGTETFTTNDLGGVPAAVGTENIGCVPAPGVPCDFTLATGSRVFGTAATGGFLRWDAGAPVGYLGDGVTPHTISPGPNGALFSIVDPNGANPTQTTNQFIVAGKISGSLASAPNPIDFGAVPTGTTATKTVTVTNLDSSPITLGAVGFGGVDGPQFGTTAASQCAVGTQLARDASCTYSVSFTPTAVAGTRSAQFVVPSTGGVRSPLIVPLTGSEQAAGQSASITLSTATLAFGNVRVRETSPLQRVTLTNSGTSALTVSKIEFDPTTFPEYDHYRIMQDTCATGSSVTAGGSCFVDVSFSPFTPGAHNAGLLVTSNDPAGPRAIALTGTGTGGLAAVAPSKTTLNDGFPDWYMDDQGVKVSQCTDDKDPFCVLLPDAFYDPSKPISFPSNFPVEFFYQVATSDNLAITDPACSAAPGKAFMRSAIEGAFPPAGPADGTQLVFGRIRFSVTRGLCPDTEYIFTSPYGADRFTTDSSGGLKRKDGTNDVGCLIGGVGPCDFTLALSSRVLGSVLRWDPAVAPAAPVGYLGDAVSLHPIVGAPYSPDGITPANYFSIARADDGVVLDQTNQFSVMGKLRGPLESDLPTLNFGSIGVGSTSGSLQETLTNTGISPLTITSVAPAGTDTGDFTVDGAACMGQVLAPAATCAVSASFAPTATGNRSAAIRVRHTGMNDPFDVMLTGIGGAAGTAANISFIPRSEAFGALHVGRPSEVEKVTISNSGGTLPLTIHAISTGGTNPGDYHVVNTTCPTDANPGVVGVGATCSVDVAFSATAAGARSATLVVTDSAPGATHSMPLSGTGVSANKDASTVVDDRNGFPTWYQDDSGNRLEPCLDKASGSCVLIGDAGYNPNNPIVFPTNFPAEFFYALADSHLISTPGCPAAGVGPGTALLRMALEGSFANGTPIAGDQITFGRMRVVVDGLCPSVPYTFITPWGPTTVTTDATGAIKAKAGTTDVGSTPATAALAGPIAAGFPRWNPNVGLAAPAGFLGDGASYHVITGGTYTPPGSTGTQNAFVIQDSAGNEIARTDQFLVSGKVAGPLQSNVHTLDFGHTPTGTPTGSKSATLANVAFNASTTISTVGITGVDAAQFGITGGSCVAGAVVGANGTCSVNVRFAPTTSGTKSAQVVITPANGPAVSISLSGTADVVGAPAATVTPGVLAFGTRNVGTSTTLITNVRNSGTAVLSVSGESLIGSAAGDFKVVASGTNPSCPTVLPFNLAPGVNCNIAVTFSPKANGARSATLSITHNATGSPTAVSLSGTGVASSFVMSPSPIGFSNVNINSTKSQSVTIKNTGAIAFTLTSASITGAQAASFTITGAGCIGISLASGKTCNISVNLTPTQRIAYSGTLNVFGDSTTVPSPVTNALTGTGK